jgi:type I restriction enzyme, S subunit
MSDLPTNWIIKSLRELHSGKIGNLDPSTQPEEEFEYYSIPAYQNGINPTRTQGKDIHSQKLIIPNKCLLFGKLNPRVEKVWNVESTSVLRKLASTEWLPFIIPSGYDQKFCFYLLRSEWVMPLAQGLVSGSTPSRERVEPKSFYDIQVPIPTISEQRKIASILWEIDTSIFRQENEEKKASRIKRAAMRELFSRGLRGEAQKETEIGLVPESWEVDAFSTVREWLQYGTSERCTIETGKYPVLRIPNIETGRVNCTELKYCKLSDTDANRYRLMDGDLLFIRTNGVRDRLGCCAVYSGEPSNSLFASYLIRARLKREEMEPLFIAQFLGSENGTDLVAGRATPAADGKFNLNTGTIDSIPIPIPPTLEEQREIVEILDAIDRKIELHKKKKALLEELFTSLLHKLMTGEIRVDELDLSALNTEDIRSRL